MAYIQLDSAIPNNIVELSANQARRIRWHFERGDVVVLRDARVVADYDYFAKIEPPLGPHVRKDKYVFTKALGGVRQDRPAKWQPFELETFAGNPDAFHDFKQRVQSVERQISRVVQSIFGRTKFSREFIAWKFQRVEGENLHIDNLQGCNDVAQFRIFVNLDARARQWAVGRHWRYYASRHFKSLGDVAGDAFSFNGRLSETAFGPSWRTCDEPRHLLEFSPGEIWLTNSALVAHQVRKGNLLVAGHYEYAFEKCIDRSNSLPSQLAALSGATYSPTWADRLGRLADFMMGLRARDA